MSDASATDTARLFDTSIFELLGIEQAPSETKDKILATMMETVQRRVASRIMDALDPDEVEAFEAALEKGDEAVRPFLDEAGVDLVQLTAEEVMLYKAEVFALVKGGVANLATA